MAEETYLLEIENALNIITSTAAKFNYICEQYRLSKKTGDKDLFQKYQLYLLKYFKQFCHFIYLECLWPDRDYHSDKRINLIEIIHELNKHIEAAKFFYQENDHNNNSVCWTIDDLYELCHLPKKEKNLIWANIYNNHPYKAAYLLSEIDEHQRAGEILFTKAEQISLCSYEGEIAANYYIKAGEQFKLAKLFLRAGQCYSKAAERFLDNDPRGNYYIGFRGDLDKKILSCNKKEAEMYELAEKFDEAIEKYNFVKDVTSVIRVKMILLKIKKED